MTVVVPEPLAGRLAAEAARRGVSPESLAVETLQNHYGADTEAPDMAGGIESFIGCFDSGDPDWASTNTQELRAQAAQRRPA